MADTFPQNRPWKFLTGDNLTTPATPITRDGSNIVTPAEPVTGINFYDLPPAPVTAIGPRWTAEVPG